MYYTSIFRSIVRNYIKNAAALPLSFMYEVQVQVFT